MFKTKTIAKGKCFGSPARQRDSLVYYLVTKFNSKLTLEEKLSAKIRELGTKIRYRKVLIPPKVSDIKRHHITRKYIY